MSSNKLGSKSGIVDVGAVRGIAIAAGTSVHSDPLSILGREMREGKIIEVDEAMQQLAGRIEFHRQPPFREVDLNFVRALVQAAADLGFMLAEQVFDELFARVAGNLLGRVHQAQRRRRNDRLLDRHVRVSLGHFEITSACRCNETVPPVSRGMRRTCPAANGILKPSGAMLGRP